MIRDFKYLIGTFPKKDKLRLVLYVIAQFFVALMDLLGLAAILPLMQVLLGADMQSGYLGILYRALGSPSRETFGLLAAVIVVLAFAMKAILALMLQWWSGGFVIRLQIASSKRLLEVYLDEDYLTHRGRDSADVIKTVDTAVADAHSKVLAGSLSLLSSGLSILLIVGFLFVIAPWVTLAALVYFLIIVFFIQKILGDRNRKAGYNAIMSAWGRSLALLNAAAGFREVRMHNARAEFVERFKCASEEFGAASRKVNFYSMVPKYFLEFITIAAITAVVGGVVISGGGQDFMPTMALFVAAAIKFLPLLSAITAVLGLVRVGQSGLRIAVEALRNAAAATAPIADTAPVLASHETIPPVGVLKVRGVGFQYPDGNQLVLDNINLTIPAGSSLALCGASGSGKTTLVDVILGLLPPTKGSIEYAQRQIREWGYAWYELVAYVPQDTYLLNDSISANVAFGLPEKSRDERKIWEVLAQAHLSEVVTGLDSGIDTELGERGIRLSGGQRQRLGIARALYRDPKILIFDEATSALDNETENQITQTVQRMSGDITTIIIAHRLSTVRHVDQLAYLKDGRIDALGTFEEVRERSAEFARMVELGRLDVAR